MALKTVPLENSITISDITHKDLVKVEIEDEEGVVMVRLTYMNPDSRGMLRNQVESIPLSETQASGSFDAWFENLT